MKVFSDTELKNEVISNVLFENQEYYILFEDTELTRIKRERKNLRYFDLLPFGKIARVNFKNKIGFFSLLDQQFDVRSKKLGDLTGNDQASNLISEINSLFKQLSFNYSGITVASRHTNFSSANSDLMSRFDYFRQAILSGKQPSFESCLNLILKFPHHKLKEDEVLQGLHKGKNISLKALFGPKTTFEKMNSNQFDKLTLTKKLRAKGKEIFPSKVITVERIISTDTRENRFVKYFLNEISNLCFYIIHNYASDEFIVADARKVKSIIDSYLARPFFKDISVLSDIPYNSTTLLKGNGYKELFYHYVQSRYSFDHMLDKINKGFNNSGLNDISYLYEVWCFLKVARVILKGSINVLAESQIYKDGHLAYKLIWRDQSTAIGFNVSYSHAKGTSYSLTLRPDISLIFNYGSKKENLILFDAKYKVIGDLLLAFNPIEENRTYNAQDIHKMHAYLDAIPKAFASYILYPGNKYIFFGRDFTKIESSTTAIRDGVGAIPLIPGTDSTDLINVITSLSAPTLSE